MAVTVDAPHALARARYLHVSAYKVRQVLDLVRGLPVDDAFRVLQLCEKDAADDVLKVLDAAVANAEHNNQLPADELFLAVAYADEGPTRKWGQPRARGRYFRVRKRTTHLTLIVARYDEDELERRRRIDESSGRGAAVAQRRRADRVRKSRQRAEASDHDHDHDEHDHDHEHEPEAQTDELLASAEESAQEPEGDETAGDEGIDDAADAEEPEAEAADTEPSEKSEESE
jgi:large subunit ribosomal protein L22